MFTQPGRPDGRDAPSAGAACETYREFSRKLEPGLPGGSPVPVGAPGVARAGSVLLVTTPMWRRF